MNNVSYTNTKHYNFANCNKTSNGEYDQNPMKMSYDIINTPSQPTSTPKKEYKNYAFINCNNTITPDNSSNASQQQYSNPYFTNTPSNSSENNTSSNYCSCNNSNNTSKNNSAKNTYENTTKNYSSLNAENNWSKIPYPNTHFTSIGETPSCGFWPLYYFKRTPEGTFIDLNNKQVNFSIKTPDCFDDFSGKELNDVLAVNSKLTNIQKNIATYWGAGVPENQFIPILQNLINAYSVSVMPSTRMYSILFTAFNDALVLCWYYKYTYNIPRPIQYAPYFTPYLTTPQHPSYPAGHSVIAGCFATIVSFFFPKEKEKIYKLANECSISRLFAGVHYPLDLKEGFSLGEDIASKILNMVANDSDQHCSNVNLVYNDFKNAKIEPTNYTQIFNI